MSHSIRLMLKQNLQILLGQEKRVGLSFSGGTDSLCLLFVLLNDLQIKPALYTYHVKGVNSLDLQVAKYIAKEFGLSINVASIPTDIEEIVKDIKELIKRGIRGKVCIQCMHGHFRLAPLVSEPIIANGSGIDALYGVYKSYLLKGAKESKFVFDQLRAKALENPNDDAMINQADCYGTYGVRVIYPYRQENIINYLMEKSWEAINKPRLKWITVKDFPEFQKGIYRPRGSQQIVAGTRALHNLLLNSKYNVAGHRSVVGIYNSFIAEMNNEQCKAI